MVFYANPDYYPPTRNAAAILSKYFEVTVVCRNMGRSVVRWPRQIAIERVGSGGSEDDRHRSNPIGKFIELRNFMGAVRDVVARIQPTLIFAYEPHAFCAALGSSRRIRMTPLIFQLHELPEFDDLPWRSLQTWVIRRAVRETRAASLLIFPEKNRAEIWTRAARDTRPPLIIPNCAALGFTPDGYDVAGLIERRLAAKRVLYVGALGESNGHGEAVQSLAFLESSVSLQMVGQGSSEYRQTLIRSAAELGVLARLSIGEFVEHARLTEPARDATVGLALYKPVTLNWEFSGSATNKVFEYAALGLPVVAPDRASYREFFADETWITFADPTDPRSIARAIEFVLADRARYARMSLAARRAFEQKFNYERVFQPVLEQALALAGASRPDDPARPAAST
ncbi:MAG: glycosyltransferase family protein [Candidatus Binataceae bacterium]